MQEVPDYHSIRATLAAHNKSLSAMMSHVLRGSGVRSIDVRFKGAHINATSFLKVRHLVESGQVLVFHEPNLDAETGFTSSKYDVVAFSFDTPDNLYRKSCIIHEAVHVRNDMRGKDTVRQPDELMSWIVQAVYLRWNGHQADNWPGATDRRTLPAALAIADSLLTGNSVTHAQELALISALLAKKEYKDMASAMTGANGIRPLRH